MNLQPGGEVNTSDGSYNANLLAIRNKSVLTNSREEITPERRIPDMHHMIGASITDKRAHNKYLLPATTNRGDVNNSMNIPSGFKHLRVTNTKSFKEPLQPALLNEDTPSPFNEQ
jgi:hypothetical protein